MFSYTHSFQKTEWRYSEWSKVHRVQIKHRFQFSTEFICKCTLISLTISYSEPLIRAGAEFPTFGTIPKNSCSHIFLITILEFSNVQDKGSFTLRNTRLGVVSQNIKV